MSTTETLSNKTPSIGTSAVETSTTTTPATAIETTATGSSVGSTSQDSTEIQSTSSILQTSEVSALPSTSSTPPARNILAFGEYTFTGCLRSLEGYPSFTEVATDPEMTTRKCVDLAFGSDVLGATLSVSDSIITKTTSESRLPTSFPTPTAIQTAYSIVTIDHAYTKTQFAETVTTVTYTTVNPSNPAALITTCVPITLLYSPCGLEDIVTLTVPKAAYETGRESHTHPIVQYPSGWVGGYQTDAGGKSYPVAQPTAGSQVGSQPGSVNSRPETFTRATGLQDHSHPSYKMHQPATPTLAAGSNSDTHPEQGNAKPSVPAQGLPESNNNTPTNPSQPSSPKSLTTETSIIPTPQLDNPATPSQSSPPHYGQVPSEPKETPYATSMVVSEAHSYELSSWIMITAIVGMVLL
ncbi:hypothetical protein ACKAV7_008279 [Fusarium commune]